MSALVAFVAGMVGYAFQSDDTLLRSDRVIALLVAAAIAGGGIWVIVHFWL